MELEDERTDERAYRLLALGIYQSNPGTRGLRFHNHDYARRFLALHGAEGTAMQSVQKRL